MDKCSAGMSPLALSLSGKEGPSHGDWTVRHRLLDSKAHLRQTQKKPAKAGPKRLQPKQKSATIEKARFGTYRDKNKAVGISLLWIRDKLLSFAGISTYSRGTVACKRRQVPHERSSDMFHNQNKNPP